MSIRAKISLGFTLVSLGAGVAVLFFVRNLTSTVIENSVAQEVQLLASQTIASVDRIVYRRLERWEEFFDINETALKAIQASNAYFDSLANPQAVINQRDNEWTTYPQGALSPAMAAVLKSDLSDMLSRRARFYEEKYSYKVFPEIFITDKYGVVVASTDRTSDYYQADEAWWQKAAVEGSFIGDYQYDESSNSKALQIYIKIHDARGEFAGVGKVVYDISDILQVLEEEKAQKQSTSTQLVLTTGEDLVIFPHDRSQLNKQEALSAINKENTIAKFAVSNGYKEFKSLGWTASISYDRQEILEPLYTAVKKITGVVSLAVALCAFSAMVLAKLITKPLVKLKQSVELVEGGDLDHQIDIRSRDEIGKLSQAFNKMVLAVKEARKDVDKKVADQTREIIKKNKDLHDQQKAVLNVLEDMAEAKLKLQNYALDLQKFKLAVDYTAEHVVITDPNGIILYANKAVTQITGFENSEILGKKAGSKILWGGKMPQEIYMQFWKTIKVDKKPFTGEFNNKRKNGEAYIAEANVAPVLNDAGEVIFFVGIERDITRAKEIDRMKTEFISLASHQLRTPLSSMKWFSEMLLNGDAGELTPNQKEFVQNIYDSNERMVALVNSLLNISRIESGRIIVDPKPVNLKDLAERIIKELKPKIAEKSHTVRLEVENVLPTINVDPQLTAEVYKNLLTNAIKYTPAKGQITVTIKQIGAEIVSQITDTGYGIPEKSKAKIFDKFYRAENIVKLESDGTGLGLYLIKAIVESSNGRLWFDSTEGKGSTFSFSLPISGVQAKEGVVSIVS